MRLLLSLLDALLLILIVADGRLCLDLDVSLICPWLTRCRVDGETLILHRVVRN